MGKARTAGKAGTVKFNFTKRAIEALPVPESGHAQVYDEQVRGLGLVCQPSGRRTFFWFRKVRGRPLWRNVGDWPDLSVEQARATATEWNSRSAAWKASGYAGPSPFERPVQEPTLDVLVDEYISRHLREHAKRPASAEKNLRWMVGFYLASWKGRRLDDIRSEDVAGFHRRAGTTHGHRTANIVVKKLRTLFRFAVRAKLWRGEIPTAGIVFYPENKRTRFLQPDELPRLWRALRDAPNPDLRDFVNISLFSGARKSDVFSMRWQDLSLSEGRWTVPDPKSRVPYVIPLGPEVVEILQARLRVRVGDNPWVFPGRGRTGHLVDLKGRWRELLEAAGLDYAGQPELRPTQHDLRRTQGSWQAGLGASLLVIGKSLGHQSAAATQIYSRLNLDPVRESMAAANTAMRAAMRKKKPKLLKVAPWRKAAGRA